jgi:peptidoglycan-associated lipoprotein
MFRRTALPVAAVLLASFLAACSGSEEKKAEPTPPQTNYAPPPAPAAPPVEAKADLSQHSIYFDFDKSLIKPEGQPVIASWAGYLTSHPTERVRIEGNCDERGTREYNIGLGERRANAVATALESKGVAASQLEVISYGKERPVATGHDEASWSQNRRADLVKK